MKVVWMKPPRVSGRSLAQILGRAFCLSARDLPGWWMRAVRSCVCNSRAAVLWTVVFCSLAALTGSVAASEKFKTTMADPLIAVHDGFVDEKTCSSCHADQAAAFAKSHHAKAMTVADDKSVLGNFNNIQFDRDGVVASFFRRDDRFFVRTEGPDGKQADYEVKYTFAYEPLQQYLVDLGGGRLQALDIAWDTQKREWFWLGEGSAAKPGSTFHWTGPFYRWNRTCIDCHSTDPRTNFEPQSNEYNSSYVATSIGCQSCHGGGAKHIEWARAKAANASTAAADPGLAKVNSNTCFACHARRTRLVDRYQPGGTLSRSVFPCIASQRPLFSGRADPGRGFRIRFLPAKQDGNGRRDLFRLPPAARGYRQGRGQWVMHAVPRRDWPGTFCRQRPERRVRHPGTHASSPRLTWRSLRQLSHAGTDLHEGRSPTRSFLRHSSP